MPPNIDAWTTNTFPLGAWSNDTDPGVANAQLLTDKTTTITVRRGDTTKSAQNVRIEELRARDRDVVSEAGLTAKVDALVIGYKGHPTISDTDLQRGDRFSVEGGDQYDVVAIMPGLVNSMQAYVKVRS